MKKYSWHLSLVLMLLVALGLRVYWVINVGHSPLVGTGDQQTYANLGGLLSNPRHLRSYSFYYITPGYPLFLGAIHHTQFLLGINAPFRGLVGLVQAVLSIASLWLMAVTMRRRFSSAAGSAVVLVAILWAGQTTVNGTLSAERLATPMAMTAICLILWDAHLPSRWRLVSIGALFTIALIAKPILLPMFGVALVILVLRGKGRTQWLSVISLVSLPVLLVVGGWTLRVYQQTGHFAIGGSTASGFNICLGNNDLATGGWDDEAAIQECGSANGTNKPSVNAQLQDKGLRWMKNHPGKEPSLVAKRWGAMFDRDYGNYGSFNYPGVWKSWSMPSNPRHVEAMNERAWSLIKFLSLIGLGGLLIGEKYRRVAAEMVALAAASLAIPLISVGDPRYREVAAMLMITWVASLAKTVPDLLIWLSTRLEVRRNQYEVRGYQWQLERHLR